MFGFWKRRRPENAQEAIDRGDHEAALQIYRRSLAARPDEAARWQRKIAETLLAAGRADEAVEAYLDAARHLERDELPLQAIALYKAALRIRPEHPAAMARLQEFAPAPDEEDGDGGPGDGSAAERATMTLRTRLRKYAPLFSEFDRETLTAVVEVMRTVSLVSGDEVFQQGDEGDSLFVVADGEVALTVEGPEGDPVEIDRIQAGSCFGEVSALRRVPRNVTAIATRPTELLELGRDYLEAVAIAHPQVWKVLEDFQQRRLVPVGV